MKHTVLVLCEDSDIGADIRCAFEESGFLVEICSSAGALPEKLTLHRPSAVIISANGISSAPAPWCQFACAFTDLPVIVSGGSDDATEEMECLAAGARDYVLVSRGLQIVVMRTDQHIRRAQMAHAGVQPIIIGEFRLHPETRIATYGNQSLHLTRTEFEVMNVLMANAHRVVHRRELIDRVWGSWYGDPHVLETHLSRLRHKVHRAGGPRIATPIRGVGYRLTTSETPTY